MKKNRYRFFLSIAGFAVVLAAAIGIGMGCRSAPASPEMQPGTYREKAAGFNGEYEVSVTIGAAEIQNIEISGLNDSVHTGIPAIEALKAQILETQTCGLDVVTGATISSRSFLNAVKAALTAAGASGKFVEKPRYSVRDEAVTVDVLVIGSGIAGLSAAAQVVADKPDAKVTVLEKLPFIGGSSKFAAGVVLGPEFNIPFNPDSGIKDGDIQALKEYYKLRGQGWIDETLVSYWVDEAWETLQFLDLAGLPAVPSGTMTEMRMRLPPTPGFVPGAVNASGGYALVTMLANRAKAGGVTILTGVRATDLITQGDAVTGVKAESNTVRYTFTAKAVIIATGGYDSDRELMGQYNKDSSGDIPQSSKGSTGDGIKMARKIGADLVFKGGKIGWVAVDNSLGEAMHYSAWIIQQDGGLLDYTAPAAQSAGYVNSAGVTTQELSASAYTNNPQDYAVNHLKMLEARAGAGGNLAFYGLYRGMGPDTSQPPDGTADPEALPTDGYTGGDRFVTRAASIDELAGKIPGMDPAKLAAAFDASGKNGDSYAGDYILVQAVPSSIGSMGGIKINVNAEVLKGGQPIPGLYAAGETANGDMFYREYPGSGSSLSISATFGRTAGRQAASAL